MSFPVTMSTNGLIAPAGVTPLPINTNGHLCIKVVVEDPEPACPLIMNTNGLMTLFGISPLMINTNGHLCGFPSDDVADGGGRMSDLHRQRILEDDKIILKVIKNFMESIATCH